MARKTVKQRYGQLSFWEKVGFWSSVVTILGAGIGLGQFGLHHFAAQSADQEHLSSNPQKPFTAVFKAGRRALRSAPTVTFFDKQQAIVEFSYTAHVEVTTGSNAVVVPGITAEDGILDSKVVATVLSNLERTARPFVHTQRRELEKNIEDELRPVFSRVGLSLDAFALIEIKDL